MSTFVSVGNAHQPFARMLTAVSANFEALPPPVVVQHGHTPFADKRCRCVPFFEMSTFDVMMARSKLIIVQAGGGGVLQALKRGKVPVIVARRHALGEHIDDHQVSWARALAGTSRVILLEDVDQLTAAASSALALQALVATRPRTAPLIGLVREALLKSR